MTSATQPIIRFLVNICTRQSSVNGLLFNSQQPLVTCWIKSNRIPLVCLLSAQHMVLLCRQYAGQTSICTIIPKSALLMSFFDDIVTEIDFKYDTVSVLR